MNLHSNLLNKVDTTDYISSQVDLYARENVKCYELEYEVALKKANEEIENILNNKENRVWKLFADEKHVANVWLIKSDEQTIHVGFIEVLEKFRGMGFGNCKRIHGASGLNSPLKTFRSRLFRTRVTHNEIALNLYKSLGYECPQMRMRLKI